MEPQLENLTIDDGSENPKSLFKICLKYVAEKIDLVDSLEGFPDMVGEQIFHKCLELDTFTQNNDKTEKAIGLFVNSYGQDFISMFKCKTPQVVNEYTECLAVLCLRVTHLDLCGCQLGNNHDILRVVVQMENLVVLNLAKNGLSDDGFRQLTAVHRMYSKGFQHLSKLDVSENVVSIKILKILVRLPSIGDLRISIASSMKCQPSFTHCWTNVMLNSGYRIIPDNGEIVDGFTTHGWGSPIVDTWEKEVERIEQIRQNKVFKKGQGFYSNSFKKKQIALLTSNIRTDIFQTYVYSKGGKAQKNVPLTNVSESEINRKTQSYLLSNNKRSFEQVESPKKLPPPKKQNLDIDMDILKMYM